MKIKIFCDSADIQTIKKFSKNPLVNGFTTNPSLMKLSGAKNYKIYSLKLLNLCSGKPISLEVFADDFKEMEAQAYKINSWGKNIYVKVPIINSKGFFSGPVIKILSNKGLKLNITAVYTVEQVKKIISKINKKSKTIISIFAGRMGDVGKDPLPIIKESVRLTRESYNYLQAKDSGCSIITIPPNIIYKISKFGKSYKELTLDTVKKFLIDSKESKFKI